MKSGIMVDENEIIVSSGKKIAGSIVFAGFGMLVAGGLGYLSPLLTNTVVGVGLIVLSGGFCLFLNSRRYSIYINEEKEIITIIESGIRCTNRIDIPLSYYTGVLIQRKMGVNVSGGKASSRHEIMLINDFGSGLIISVQVNEKKAFEYAKTLQSRFRLTIHHENEMAVIMKKHRVPTENMIIQLPSTSKISRLSQGDTVSLSWRIRRNPLNLLSGGVCMYGVSHLIIFAAVPLLEGSIFLYLLYYGIAVGMLLFLAIAVVNLVGTHHLDITSERLSYYIRIFGKKIVKRVMDSASIGLIKNSIGGPEERIQVMSSRGLVAVRKISEKIKGDTSKSPDMSIVGELLSLKDAYIDIPVKSLSLAEKLFIENMILRRIPVSG